MLKKFVITLAVALIVGCAGADVKSKAAISKEAKKNMAVARAKSLAASEFSNVHFLDTFYVPELSEGDKLKPNWFFQPEIISSSTLVLSEIMGSVFNKRGIGVRYVDGVDPLKTVNVAHNGTIGSLLDKMSSSLGYYYTFDANSITWSRYQTETMDVAFFAGTTSFFFGSDGQQQSSQAATSQTVVETSASSFSNNKEFVNYEAKEVDVWGSLSRAIQIQLSDEGKFELSSSQLVVKDLPENVSRVKNYINSINDTLTQQIQVDIEVIEFTSNNGENYSVDWELAKMDLASGGIFNFISSLQPEVSAVQPTILSYTQQTGKYAGSSALISALAQQGVVHSVGKRTILSMNNQPTVSNVGDKRGYLASAGSTSTANVGSNDVLQIGILNTGESFKFLPRAFNGNVMVRLSTSSSRQNALRRVSDGNKTLEAPETTYDENLLNFVARDGDTVLVSSRSVKTQSTSEDRNVLSFLFGGRSESKNNETEVIILMTPRIVRLYD